MKLGKHEIATTPAISINEIVNSMQGKVVDVCGVYLPCSDTIPRACTDCCPLTQKRERDGRAENCYRGKRGNPPSSKLKDCIDIPACSFILLSLSMIAH